jgi:hypothetical protein
MSSKSMVYGIWAAALAGTGATGSGCGGETSGDGDVCAQLVSKFQQCKIFTPGKVSCGDLEAASKESRCAINCLQKASCEELRIAECDREVNNSLGNCAN